MPKKTERGALWDIPTSILSRNSKKIEGGTLWGKKIFPEKSHNAEKPEREDPLGVFNIHFVAKHQKIEGKIFIFGKKISLCRKKLKGGPFGFFQHPFCRKTVKKTEGGTLWGKKIFRKKVTMPKKLKGDPLVSPGMVCYARKQEKFFWFSSLGQMVQ